MVWAPPSLGFPNADLTVQAVAEFVKDLNQHSRFAGLSLGGNEGAVSAGAVCAWQSGFPLRVSFASGKPDYDIERYSMARLLAAKESDLLIWIASYTPDLSPPDTDVPMIVLGTPGLKLSRQPAVFIPVGTPGADHAGLIVRCDNVVSLPLEEPRPLEPAARRRHHRKNRSRPLNALLPNPTQCSSNLPAARSTIP